MNQWEKREDKRYQLSFAKEKGKQKKCRVLKNIYFSTVIGIQDIKRNIQGLGLVPQKGDPIRSAQDNAVTAAKPCRSQDFPVLQLKYVLP
ncbi:hypothetical protein NPIL_555851 [Nephila pilipes]|uniref:Uncharacterized protein n=1 Tax=Nephila pilipes TaxID=299642 RepID=A0A8X6Q2P8_NEPPI|nr:hypothetical protein NPIL_555851 [Nephila pilipes]